MQNQHEKAVNYVMPGEAVRGNFVWGFGIGVLYIHP